MKGDTKAPLVSVIMAVYKEPENILKEAIESILSQSYENIELVIVYDDPDGDLLLYLQEFELRDPRVTLVLNANNYGLAKSLNIAIDNANGFYIARMDADDIALPFRLEEQKRHLEEHRFDLVGCGIQRFDSFEQNKGVTILPASPETLVKLQPYATIAFHPTWFLRRSLYESCRYDEGLLAGQDYELLSKFKRAGAKISNLGKVALKYRVNETSISNSRSLDQVVAHWYVNHLDCYEDFDSCKRELITAKEKKYYPSGFETMQLFFNTKRLIHLLALQRYLINSKLLRYKFWCFLMSKKVRFFAR